MWWYWHIGSGLLILSTMYILPLQFACCGKDSYVKVHYRCASRSITLGVVLIPLFIALGIWMSIESNESVGAAFLIGASVLLCSIDVQLIGIVLHLQGALDKRFREFEVLQQSNISSERVANGLVMQRYLPMSQSPGMQLAKQMPRQISNTEDLCLQQENTGNKQLQQETQGRFAKK